MIGTDVLAEQTIGIADDNLLEVDGSPNDDEYARFTANGLEGRTEAEFKGDFNLQIGTDVLAQQTIGIANDNLLEVDDAGAADDEYARFTANGLEGRAVADVRSDINVADGADVTANNAPQAHKDSHDPEDGISWTRLTPQRLPEYRPLVQVHLIASQERIMPMR